MSSWSGKLVDNFPLCPLLTGFKYLVRLMVACFHTFEFPASRRASSEGGVFSDE